MLSRLPVSKMFTHTLESNQFRSLLWSEYCIENASSSEEEGHDTLAVATVHLESLKPNKPLRAKQLYSVPPLSYAHVVVVVIIDVNDVVGVVVKDRDIVDVTIISSHILLTQALPVLSSAAQTAILMGDFNFCATWPDENATIANYGYTDLWPALHADDPGAW